jgi:hypothetical protein
MGSIDYRGLSQIARMSMARRQVGLQRSSLPPVKPETDGTFQASMANELADTVEHLLSTRYAAQRLAEESPPKRVVQTVTSESLLAELAAARQAQGYQPTSRAAEPEPPRRSGLSLGKILALGGVAVILLVFACLSPFRDYVPSPLRDQVDRAAHFLK